jgi:hypothetical protein
MSSFDQRQRDAPGVQELIMKISQAEFTADAVVDGLAGVKIKIPPLRSG